MGEESEPRAGPQPDGLDTRQRGGREIGSDVFAEPGGVLRIRASANTITTSPNAATDRYAGVHPEPVRIARNGTADRTWPSWPQIPVNWATNGTRAGSNQYGTRRRTEMKVSASPKPTIARAPIAAGSDSLSARTSWPAVISAAPQTMSTTGTEAVQQQSGGNLSRGVHDHLQHDERGQHPRARGKSVCGLETRDAEGCAVEDGDDVGE